VREGETMGRGVDGSDEADAEERGGGVGRGRTRPVAIPTHARQARHAAAGVKKCGLSAGPWRAGKQARRRGPAPRGCLAVPAYRHFLRFSA
jgi:hypothetical protein